MSLFAFIHQCPSSHADARSFTQPEHGHYLITRFRSVLLVVLPALTKAYCLTLSLPVQPYHEHSFS